MGAYVCDAFIIAFCTKALDAVSQFIFRDIFQSGMDGLVALILVLGFSYGYHIHLMHRYGATPGKKLLNIQVVNLHGEGLSYKQAWLRVSPYLTMYCLPIILLLAVPTGLYFPGAAIGYFALLPLWYIVSAIVLAAHPHKRTLHDLIARTVVVYNPPKLVPVSQVSRPE